MKITNVKVDVFKWQVEPWRVGAGMRFGGPRQLGVVTVETDEGISGNAFLSGPNHHAQPLIDIVKPRVMGQNPQDIGAIWRGLWRQTRAVSTSVIGAVDICYGNQRQDAGRTIHELGTCKDSVPVYSSTAYWETKEEYQEEALRFKEDGWTAHKIHPHSDPKADVAICEAVREAVGDDMKLMLDSMWAYEYEDSVRVGRAIEDLGYYWYEDPLAEEDLYSYVKLNEKLDIPIMATEFAPGRYYGMTQWITNYATDILRGDVAVTGGITPLVRLCHLAEGFKMKCEIHHGGNSLNNVANLHVTMAVPNASSTSSSVAIGLQRHGLVEDNRHGRAASFMHRRGLDLATRFDWGPAAQGPRGTRWRVI